MKSSFLLLICVMAGLVVMSQDMEYTHKVIKELASEKYFGRGYVNKGDSIAADFLANEFENIGLKKYKESYFQRYITSINSYSEKPELIFGDKKLNIADDFIAIPNSSEADGWYKLEWITANTLTNPWALKHLLSEDHPDSFICIDSTGLNNEELYKFANVIFGKNYINAKGVIEGSASLKFTARTEIEEYVHLQIKPELINTEADSVYVKIENDYVVNYETQNVIGYKQGKTDSIIMFTAHYDHLGMVGDIIYPGANDNASGVSMVLNLAKYFAGKKKSHYTIVFALFSGEEAGLLGSEYMANNPPLDLSKVKVLINFDMVGTGDDGIYMLNAKEYPEIDSMFIEMNADKKYFDVMHSSKATYSSDHASFYAKGVDAVFIYAAGNNQNYHQPQDTFADLTFAEYEDIYQFCIDMVKKMKTKSK